MEVTNRFIAISHHVNGSPAQSDFQLKTKALSLSLDHGSDYIIVKNLYVSIDPYQINRMKSYSSSQKTSSFAVAIVPGEAVDSYGLGKVVASANEEFKEGELVAGIIEWAEYSKIIPADKMIRKLDPMGFPLSYHVSALAFGGLTAYAGLFAVCEPKKGEKVFVSTASGSVGHLVGQYAKLHGCYVVGSAGSQKKVALLKEKLGFDDAFNYKDETDLKSTLERYFPDGIDVYFDNVGGEMLEAAVANMNSFGRIALCGVISEYTDKTKRAAPNMLDILYKRIKIQGFLAGDFFSIYADFFSATLNHLRNGDLHVLEDISVGLEAIPSAFIELFSGDNIGKKMVRIAEE